MLETLHALMSSTKIVKEAMSKGRLLKKLLDTVSPGIKCVQYIGRLPRVH